MLLFCEYRRIHELTRAVETVLIVETECLCFGIDSFRIRVRPYLFLVACVRWRAHLARGLFFLYILMLCPRTGVIMAAYNIDLICFHTDYFIAGVVA